MKQVAGATCPKADFEHARDTVRACKLFKCVFRATYRKARGTLFGTNGCSISLQNMQSRFFIFTGYAWGVSDY